MNEPPAHASKLPDEDDKLLIILAHASILIGAAVIVPLVIFLWKRDTSPNVAASAKEALNFQLSVIIYSVVVLPTVFLLIGIPLLMAIGVGSFVLGIMGTIKASEGADYATP